MNKNKITKITRTSILLSLAMIIGYIESLIPPVIPFLPFIKIGFSNIVILIALLKVNKGSALTISFLKSILVPLLLGNPIMIIYSLSSSILSLLVAMSFLTMKKFGIPTISIISSITHNVTQVIVAFLVMQTSLVFSYLPFLFLVGVITGTITGMITVWIVRFPKYSFLP